MEEYVRENKIKMLLDLRGKIQIDYDREKEEQIELQHQKERGKLFKR